LEFELEMTKQNFTDYSEQASVWLAENRKELEAKDKLIGELKAALLDAIGGMAYIKAFHGELYGVGFDRIEGYRLLTKGESNE